MTQRDRRISFGVVAQVIGDSSIVAVLGPAFSGENQAVGGIFETARLVHITPSATLPTLSSHGWKTFFRAASTDLEQSTGVIALLEARGQKTFVVSDDSAYGKIPRRSCKGCRFGWKRWNYNRQS